MQGKNILISLNSCGESIEKTISLYYSTLMNNIEFYSQYKVCLFFGHNLPKKKQASIHGSILFYNNYLYDISVLPRSDWYYLFKRKQQILSFLVKSSKISYRNASALGEKDELFKRFLSYMPMEFLYPKYYKKLVSDVICILNLHNVCSLYSERNYLYFPSIIGTDFYRYKIYMLDRDGRIGVVSLNNDLVTRPYKLFNLLRDKTVVSTNSALFLAQINRRASFYDNAFIGYRKHNNNIRPNREYELNRIINSNPSVLEPENIYIKKKYLSIIPQEEQQLDDVVFSEVFKEYLHDVYGTSFKFIPEEWE